MSTLIVDVRTITVATPIVKWRDRPIARETAVLNDYAYRDDLREIAKVINPSPLDSEYRYAFDTAVITSDTYETYTISYVDLLDTAVVVSAIDTVRLATIDVTESAAAIDAIEYRVLTQQDVVDTAVLGDVAQLTNSIDDVVDTASIVSETSYRVIARIEVIESAVATDVAYPVGATDVVDSAVVLSAVTYFSGTAIDVCETAVISSAAELGNDIRRADVVELGGITSFVDTILTAKESVHEQGFLESWLYSPDGVDPVSGWGLDDAWTCNVATWAMSRYTGVGIADLGSRFAVSSGGLFERSGAYANARIETGSVSFDAGKRPIPQKKRIPQLYINGTYDTALAVDVTAELNGVKATYVYSPLTDTTGNPTKVRVDIGRKLSSFYFKFGIESTGRAELFGCEAMVHASQRRI